MSVDRLPNLHLPQSYPSTTSSGHQVSRIGSLDSSSNYSTNQYLPSLASTSSYPGITSGIGLKTPISSPGTHQISILGERSGEDSSHSYSNSNQPPHSYPGEGSYSNAMIQASQGWESQQNNMPSQPPYPTPPQATSTQYPQYQQSQQTLPGPGSYPPSNYGSYGYANGVTSPQGANLPVSAPHLAPQMLPLPGMPPGQYGHVSGGQGYPPQAFDTSGQIAPQGVKPRVTATLWEDEGSLCFQVEVKGVCVARREDNHMINGTKLLNVAGMTRGRRDGILKSEKVRHVVKIGPMHLKGVWIPFDRALDFANREKITEQLYPLFVHNIGALLYHPTNQSRTNMVMEAATRRKLAEKHSSALMGTPGSQPPALHHHHTMSGSMAPHGSQPPHSMAQYPNGRPALDRAHTFPTPPTSASSTMGMSNQGSCDWSGQSIVGGVQPNQPLSIDTGLSNTRSMPTTPATTPPGGIHPNMQGYQGQQSYDAQRALYSAAPAQQNQYASQPAQQSMRYNQHLASNPYLKNEMGPPTSRTTGSDTQNEGVDHKTDHYAHSQGTEQLSHATGEEEAEHEHDNDYAHDSHASYSANRGPLSYSTNPSISSLHGEHTQLSPEQMPDPVPHSAGRMTPRGSALNQQQWASGYHTPTPRVSSSNVYSVMSDTRAPTNGVSGASYAATSLSSAYSPSTVNGSTSLKRGRDEDDQDASRPLSRADEIDGLKRRKTIQEGGVTTPTSGGSFDRDGRPMSRSRTNTTLHQRRRPDF